MSNVQIVDLVKRFGDVHAVDHVSVEIPEGSLTAILGPFRVREDYPAAQYCWACPTRLRTNFHR